MNLRRQEVLNAAWEEAEGYANNAAFYNSLSNKEQRLFDKEQERVKEYWKGNSIKTLKEYASEVGC